MLSTTARILPGLIGVALALSAALAVAEPASQDQYPAYDRYGAGATAGGRYGEPRSPADLYQRDRRLAVESDYEASRSADALPPRRTGTEARPSDPFASRGPAGPQDPKTAAKSCLRRGREELSRGNLEGAAYWCREAELQRAQFAAGEDSPEKLALDLRRRGGTLDDAGPAPRSPRNVTSLPPRDAGEPMRQQPPAVDPNVGPEMLLSARRHLANGDVRSARATLEKVKALGVPFHPMGDTPEKVQGTIDQYVEVISQRDQLGQTEGWRRQYVKSLMDQSEALIRWRELRKAEDLAQAALEQRAPFTQYERRPETLLRQIDQLRRSANAEPRNPSEVVPAGAVTPATGEDFDRRADNLVYDPRSDRTQNVRASSQDPLPSPIRSMESIPGGPAPQSAMGLFRQGEDALKNHDTQAALELFRAAYQRANELDPPAARRCQELLQMLSHQPAPARPAAPAAEALDDATIKQQLLANQMTVEVGNKLVKARELRERDAKGSLTLLEDTRKQVEESGLDETARRQLLRRIDAGMEDTRRFIADNKSRIEMDEQNEKVKDQIDREQTAELDTQNRVAAMVDEFNTLMHERRFAEAELVAARAKQLAPENPVTTQLEVQAKLIRHLANSTDIRERKNDAVMATFLSVEEAAVPYGDDSNPIIFPEAKVWQDLTNRRSKFGSEHGRKLSEAEIKINQKLKTPVVVELQNVPLSEAIQRLGAYAGVNIHLDPQGLVDEGVPTDTPITLDLKSEVRLESALNLILRPLRLTHVVKDEVLKITSERMRGTEVGTKVYNVADLVIPIPNFTAGGRMGLAGAYADAMGSATASGGWSGGAMSAPVYLASKDGSSARGTLDPSIMAQTGGMGGGGGGASNVPGNMPMAGGPGGMGGMSMADFDSLIDLIQNTVATDKWLDNGGVGTIEPFEANLSLVISQTQDVHEEIADLLEQLRRMQDLQVTIEVRFITLNDNFFERIGVDFDFDIRDRADHPGMIFGAPTGPIDAKTGVVPRDLGDPSRDPASYTVGLQAATAATAINPNYAADMDIPFRQSTFDLAIPQFGGFDPTSGAQIGFAILSEIEAFFFIQAIQADRRTNVLQAPKVTLFNGQQATIADQSQSPFVVSVIPVVGDFAAAQQPVIVILSEGTFLTVQAVVTSDRRFVRLTIVPYFSQIGEVNTFTFVGEETTETDSSQDGVIDQPNDQTKKSTRTRSQRSGTTVQLPTFSYVTVSTTVSVPDGGTVLLGGIKRLSEGRNEAGVPILSKIPYINRLFKNVGIGRETQSLMMMVTPRIIIQEEEEEKLGINIENL